MTESDGVSPRGEDGDRAGTLVLVCGHFEGGPELADGAALLPPGIRLDAVEELCRRPEEIASRAGEAHAGRLVLAVCDAATSRLEVQRQIRRAGLDPFGVPVIDMGPAGRAARLPGAALAAALRGAVARAAAFPGSTSENARVVLAGAATIVSRRALLTMPPVEYRVTPTIDRALCAAPDGCDRCVAACPHEALSQEADAILVHRSRCESCGICVGACPHRAVRFPGNSAGEIEAELRALLGSAGAAGPAIAFTCASANAALDGSWLPVTTACAGMVPVAAMLQALSLGAGEVALRPCPAGCSNGQDGAMAEKVDFCRRLLLALGEPPDRVRLLPQAADGGDGAATPRPPLSGAPPAAPPSAFGAGAAAAAIDHLADRLGCGSVGLEHDASPLGLVVINPDSCTACGTCAVACPTDALTTEALEDEWRLLFDASLCIACGECHRLCPEQAAGAITCRPAVDLDAIRAGPQVALATQEVRCERCGRGFATRRMLDRLAGMLGDDYDPVLMGSLCGDCRGAALG